MGTKALFLDRDGVINQDTGYVYKIKEVEFVPGIFELVKRFMHAGYKIIIVTNQSGIARKMFSKEDFYALMQYIKEQFIMHDAHIDGVYYCPHHPDFDQECSCRKPKPGMLLQAQKEHDICMKNSVMIGDSMRDMHAAQAAHVGTCILLHDKHAVYDEDIIAVKHLDEVVVPPYE